MGLFYLESSSYQFLKFDFTLGFSKIIAHTCVLRPIERSFQERLHWMIETCKLPLIAIKRFPNSNIRLLKYKIIRFEAFFRILNDIFYSKNDIIRQVRTLRNRNELSIHQILINAMIISYMNNLTDTLVEIFRTKYVDKIW